MLLIEKTSNTIPNDEILYTSSDGNIVTPYDTNVFGANIVSNTYEDGKGIIKFDGDVTSIGYNAFLECNKLTSIIIPNSVEIIGRYAFQYNLALISITIPNSVMKISDGAFFYCSALTSVIIPDSVTSIEMFAFSQCYSLTSITIPNSITSIGNCIFQYCTALTSITFEGTIEQWNTIAKGPNWNLNASVTTIHCSNGDINL